MLKHDFMEVLESDHVKEAHIFKVDGKTIVYLNKDYSVPYIKIGGDLYARIDNSDGKRT